MLRQITSRNNVCRDGFDRRSIRYGGAHGRMMVRYFVLCQHHELLQLYSVEHVLQEGVPDPEPRIPPNAPKPRSRDGLQRAVLHALSAVAEFPHVALRSRSLTGTKPTRYELLYDCSGTLYGSIPALQAATIPPPKINDHRRFR